MGSHLMGELGQKHTLESTCSILGWQMIVSTLHVSVEMLEDKFLVEQLAQLRPDGQFLPTHKELG